MLAYISSMSTTYDDSDGDDEGGHVNQGYCHFNES